LLHASATHVLLSHTLVLITHVTQAWATVVDADVLIGDLGVTKATVTRFLKLLEGDTGVTFVVWDVLAL